MRECADSRIRGFAASRSSTAESADSRTRGVVGSRIRGLVESWNRRFALPGIRVEHLFVPRDRALDESSGLKVPGELQQRLVLLGFRQAGSQQQILVHPDRPTDVALLPVQAREGVIGIEVGAVGFDDPLQPGLGTRSVPGHGGAKRASQRAPGGVVASAPGASPRFASSYRSVAHSSSKR